MMIALARRHLVALAAAMAAILPLPAASAGRAADLGPAAPLVQPKDGFVGRLALDPPEGPAGTVVTARGRGLPANAELDLVWRTVQGRWKVAEAEYHGREYTPVGYVVARVTTDAAGAFAASFEVPEDFGFWHDVTVQTPDRLLTQAAFKVGMTIEISPKEGPVGTPITVEVKGIGWQQLENSWLLLYDNGFTGWMSSVTQEGSARFTIPATGRPGTHVLEVLHGDFTFPYRNMQQSPSPDRPTFALKFELTEGAPVLPPPVEAQAQAAVRGLPAPGEIRVEPAFATVGQPVAITAAGLEPGRSYPLNWSTVTGNRVSGAGWEEQESRIAEAVADASGKLVYRLKTPDDLGGIHNLRIDAGGTELKGNMWIAPSAMPLDVARGPAGTPFTVNLKGVGWTETANIYAIVYDNTYIGYACGFNSQGDVVVHLQATGDPGWHFIDFYPAIYKGKEGRPINFRLPQLTYEQDHPGEDLPRFRFAFEVTEPNVN